jgi:hypothetical protein
MPATYEKIATTTLGSAATNITFSTITSAYTDLRLVFTGVSASGNSMYLRLNGDTGSNYSFTELYGTGGDAFSSRSSNTIVIGFVSTSFTTTPQLLTADIFSYAGSTNKTVLTTAAQDNNGSGGVSANVGLWRNTAAITSVSILQTAGNIATGSTATLYGILKA